MEPIKFEDELGINLNLLKSEMDRRVTLIKRMVRSLANKKSNSDG
jgi:hypothetical protein